MGDLCAQEKELAAREADLARRETELHKRWAKTWIEAAPPAAALQAAAPQLEWSRPQPHAHKAHPAGVVDHVGGAEVAGAGVGARLKRSGGGRP